MVLELANSEMERLSQQVVFYLEKKKVRKLVTIFLGDYNNLKIIISSDSCFY